MPTKLPPNGDEPVKKPNRPARKPERRPSGPILRSTPYRPGPVDGRIESFLNEARQVIVLHGGINAQSLVRLRAVADRLGLADGEREAALQKIQEAGQTRPPEFRAYSAWLEEQLHKEKALLPPRYRQLLAEGERRFGLPAHRAEEALYSVAADRAVEVITEAKAVELLTAKVEEELGEGSVLSPEGHLAVEALGTRLGLIADVAQSVVNDVQARRLRAAKVGKGIDKVVLLVSVGVAVAALVLVGLLIGKRPARTDADSVAGEPEPAAANMPDPASQSPTAKAGWGDANLAVALADAHQRLPAQRALLERLGSNDAAERGKAYRELLAQLPRLLRQAEARAALAQLMSRAWAQEPADENGRIVHEKLQTFLPTEDTAIPRSPDRYDLAFWALEVGVLVLKEPACPPERAEQVKRGLAAALGEAPDSRQPADTLRAACRAALCRRFYSALIDDVATNPRRGLLLRDALVAKAGNDLPEQLRERLDTDFVVNGLESAGEGWKKFEPILTTCLQARNGENLVKLLAVFRTTANSDLQTFLGTALVKRTGAKPVSTDVADVVRAVEDALRGGSMTTTGPGGDRPGTFRTLAQELLKQSPPLPDRPEQCLREVVKLAHAATLGCAAAQKSAARFDELMSQKPQLQVEPAGASPTMPGQGLPRRRGRMPRGGVPEEAIRILANGRSTVPQRKTALQQLAAGLDDSTPLTAGQAETVAWYLLTHKTNAEELEHMYGVMAPLVQLRSIQLGLADLVTFAPATQAQVEKVVAAAVGAGAQFGGDRFWKEKCRQRLLRHVLDQMDPSPVLDKASEALRDLYKEQGLLLGMEVPEFLLAGGVAQVLEGLVNHLHAKLLKEIRDEAERMVLARVSREIQAAQFLGANDLERTVLLQRIWLQTLSLHVAHQKPAKGEAAQRLCTDLKSADVKARFALEQLYAGEAAVLRMWLLLNE